MAKDKNEILFSDYGINYNKEPDIFKKGTIIYRDVRVSIQSLYETLIAIKYDEETLGRQGRSPMTDVPASETSKTQGRRERKGRMKATIAIEHLDIIKNDFWDERQWLISDG